jgi:hypothetical protein
MPKTINDDPFVFFVETYFQKMARRPGGLPREKVIADAQAKLDELKPDFHRWLDEKLQELAELAEAAKTSGSANPTWTERAYLRMRALRDVGATMGFELVTFIANNLCNILEANTLNADQRSEAIDCHVKALLLVRQDQYRGLSLVDIPELVDGLRRIATTAPSSPRPDRR